MSPDDTTDYDQHLDTEGRPLVFDGRHRETYVLRAVADIRRRGLEAPSPYTPENDPRRFGSTLTDRQANELRAIVQIPILKAIRDDVARLRRAKQPPRSTSEVLAAARAKWGDADVVE